MSTLLIVGGTVVHPTGTERADVLVRDEHVAALGHDLGPADVTIDATDRWVLPGLIDTQVHFREPGLTHKEDLASGSRAAILAGVTAVLEMPNTSPFTVTPEAMAEKIRLAQGRMHTDFGFFFGATTDNAALLAEAERIPGVPGIKLFMGSSTGGLLVESDDDVRAVFANGRKRVAIHAEDEPMNRAAKAAYAGSDVRDHHVLRSAESAIQATQRAIRLAEDTGRPIHILHVSTSEETEIIAAARDRGVDVTCEVTPQHLTFTADDYATLGTRIQQNPPIRETRHRDGLWRALDDDLFAVFGSDHAPHTIEEKFREYPQSPSGMPGVQTMLPVLLDFVNGGRLTPEKLVRMACSAPAELYRIEDRGRIAAGLLADLVVVNPGQSHRWSDEDSASKCGWTPYAGRTLTGIVETVIKSGSVAVREGRIVGAATGRRLNFRA